MEPIIVGTKFSDRNNDGIVDFGSANEAKYGTKRVFFKPELSSPGKYVYWPEGYEEPKDPFDILNTQTWWGANLAGMEFEQELSIRKTDLDMYAAQGCKSVRLPMRFYRVFKSEATVAALVDLVNYGTTLGMLMVIDAHEYNDIASPEVRDNWLRLAPYFKGNPLVAFDLQNEPKGGTWQTWGADAKNLIHTLRDAGVNNLIILEWREWSGSIRADKAEKSKMADGSLKCISAWCSLNKGGVQTLKDLDPKERTWLSPHCYWDRYGSGTDPVCYISSDQTFKLGNSLQMAQKLGCKLYLGEFAWGRHDSIPSTCNTLAPKIIAYLQEHSDVYVGGAGWGWGPRWGKNYLYRGENPLDRAKTWETENAKLIKRLWNNEHAN